MLYDVALLHQYGSATYQSAVWDSATYGSNPTPFSLVMQQVGANLKFLCLCVECSALALPLDWHGTA